MKSSADRFFGGLIALLVSLCLVACDPTGGDSYTPIEDDEEARIVTLAPAMTQIIIDLGMGENIVGVAENDPIAPGGAKVVGNIANLNKESLLALRPTHVLAMRMSGAQLEDLEAMARRDEFTLALYPYPRGIDDVGLIIWNEREFIGDDLVLDTFPSLGTILDARSDASDLKYTMLHRLSKLDQVTQTLSATKPSVLLVLTAQSTITASGPGSVFNELLAVAGAVNAAAEAESPAPIYTREDLLRLNPDVIILLMPNAYPLKAIHEEHRLALFRDLDIPAVRNGRIHLINDPVILLPESTAMTKIAGEIAKVLYPEQAKRIDAAVQAELVIDIDEKKLKESIEKFEKAPPIAPAAPTPDPTTAPDTPETEPTPPPAEPSPEIPSAVEPDAPSAPSASPAAPADPSEPPQR